MRAGDHEESWMVKRKVLRGQAEEVKGEQILPTRGQGKMQ
jgi:hypothetical protein